MGVGPQNPSPPAPPHLYSQEVQLKLYQAFIFSIPILFSIILLLLFYLFYLKRRVSTLSSPTPLPLLPTSSNHSHTSFRLALKGELGAGLNIVLFDEHLRARDSQCCVCLGEFEIKEELNQVPSCKHVFHVQCISHWLHSNSTCPLCRASINIVPQNQLAN